VVASLFLVVAKVFWVILKWLPKYFGWLLRCSDDSKVIPRLFLVVAKGFWVILRWLLGYFGWLLRCSG